MNVNESSDEFEYDASGGDESPITRENDYKRGEDFNTDDGDKQSDSIDKVVQHEDVSETFENRGRGQDEVISAEHGKNSDDLFESHKLSQKIFPKICMDGMEGVTGLLTDIVGNFRTSFSNLHNALSGSTRCESSTLSYASTELLIIMDSLANVTGSSSMVFSSLSNAVPTAFRSITDVVSRLNIQTLDTQVLGVISDLEQSLTRAIQIVNDAEKLELDIIKQLNPAINLVAKSVQAIVNTLNVIAEGTPKSAIGSVSNEVQEAVVSLSLVLATVLAIVQSVYASIACALSLLQISSTTLDSVLLIIDSTLESIVGVIVSTINSISGSGSISVVIGVITMTLAYLANNFNSALETIQSSVEVHTSHSLEELLNRISESVGDIASSVNNSVTSVTSSLNSVSTTSFDLLPKVADQIHLVFKGLAKVNGPDLLIVTVLTESLQSIFDSINAASNILVSGIGAEASETMKKFTGNVQVSLNELLSLVSGSTDANVKIHEIVQEIAKSVQCVAATVTSIISKISETSTDMHLVVVEAVLALPFIFSAVLYVAQWVLSVAVSIFASMAGSVNDILSELTILISVTLENGSRIGSTIASTLSDGLVKTIDSISPYIQRLSQLISASFTKISGVVVNIVFNIDQITSGAAQHDEKPLANLLQDTEGSVPQILIGLTGTLNSISPALSSALHSLSNSFKSASTLDSPALKVISQILVIVLTLVTNVSGSASEILSLVASVLGATFGHISTVMSKFSVLGEVSVSLNTSVSNIHSALRLLIDTISDCSNDLSILNDPIKNVAKTTQILLSTLHAITNATSSANEQVIEKLSDAIINLPFVLSTVVSVIQYVLGAAVAKLWVTFGSIPSNLQQLVLAMSTILQRITSIAAEIVLSLSGSDVNYISVVGDIALSVTELNTLTSSSLSVISGILANAKVSLDAV